MNGTDDRLVGERQRQPRHRLVVQAGFEPLGHEHENLDCETLDLSMDGVSVTSTAPFRPGERGLVVIRGTELPIVGFAEVLETPHSLETVFVGRLRFTAMSDPNRRRLARLLAGETVRRGPTT